MLAAKEDVGGLKMYSTLLGFRQINIPVHSAVFYCLIKSHVRGAGAGQFGSFSLSTPQGPVSCWKDMISEDFS